MSTVEAPVADKPLNACHELVRVWDVPGSAFYRAEVTMPDKSVKAFEPVREYSDVTVSDEGLIEVNLVYKDSRVGPMRATVGGKQVGRLKVMYPYHMLVRDRKVLCALKRFVHEKSGTFALNYELFRSDIEWSTCCILHVSSDGIPNVFISERKEWLENGRVGEEKREVQIFLQAEQFSDVRLSALRPTLVPKMQLWVDHCLDTLRRKDALHG